MCPQTACQKLLELFPEVDADGKIDFNKLRLLLGDTVAEEGECYCFQWEGKKATYKLAQTPTKAELIPCVSKSKNWDTTQNIYIEGDNIDGLKLLKENYEGMIKVIYIDPPYNTGKMFLFNDNFRKIEDNLSSGWHTEWLNMMYPRLLTARDLLSDDGVIYMSIDDNEADNLKKISDEIFGEQNFICRFIWQKTATPPSLSKKCRKTAEYVLCYEKKKSSLKYFGSFLDNGDAPLLNTSNIVKTLSFPAGSIRFHFIKQGLIQKSSYEKADVLNDIIVNNGVNINTVDISARFKWTQKKLNKEIECGTFILVKTLKFSMRFQRKDSLSYKAPNNFLQQEFENMSVTAEPDYELILNKSSQVGTNESAANELSEMGLNLFDFPKPVSLIKKLIGMVCKFDKNAIVLDFFSGTGTTAQAVMELNAEDDGNRRFILMESGDKICEETKAFKSGYKTISDIGIKRILICGEKLNKSKLSNCDVGFRFYSVKNINKKC